MIGRRQKPHAVFCSNVCQREHAYKTYIERWKTGLETGVIGSFGAMSAYIRRYLVETRGEKCERCGWCERNESTGLVPITVDHVDGNWRNNTEANLRLYCPNCHSLTPTYGVLNAGNGRPRWT